MNFIKLLTFCLLFNLIFSLQSQSYFLKLIHLNDSARIFQKIEKHTNKRLNRFKAFKNLHENGLDRVYIVSFGKEASGFDLDYLSKIEGVELVELVPDYHFFHTPNDYNSIRNWNLEKIQSRDAWDLEQGGKGIVVALIDDGMDTAHQDLNYALWKNPNEIANNNIDDDNNGYIDDIMGWDMADNDNNPHVNVSDNLNHGTHCAGIIGARSNNNIGIASIGYNVKLMVLKCGRNGQSFIYNPYEAVEYAINNGARVLSMSWGGGSYSAVYQSLFDLAYQRNIVCVAAAGNSNTNIPMYPAAYNYVISVGSTTSTDSKSGFSNYGSTLDVMAPGSSIYSTLPGNNYGNMSGTSMACPLVSGLCALMLSRNGRLTAQQVENCLENTCDSIDHLNAGYRRQLGAGRINAYRALRCVKSLYAEFTSSKKAVCTGDTVRFTCTTNPSPSSYYWEFQGGTPAFSTIVNPVVRYNTNGFYNVKLRVIRNNDTDEIVTTNYIVVGKPTVKFSGFQTINKSEYATIRMDFTGVGPWTVVYRNKNKHDTVKNISSNPYFLLKQPDSSIVYKPTKVFQQGCEGTVRDSTIITVKKLSGLQSCDSSLRFHATFGGSGDDIAYDIVVKRDTNIFLAGITNTNSNQDGFLARLNKEGKVIWKRIVGNNMSDLIYTISVDDNLNSFVSASMFPQNNSSDKLMYISKFNRDGSLIWEKIFSGTSIEYMKASVISKIDPQYIYFTGPHVSNSFGGEDVLVVKCDTNGTVNWINKYGTSILERSEAICEDQFGNLHIGGIGDNAKRILIKVSSSGSLISSKSLSVSNEVSWISSMVAVNNSLYTMGYSQTGSSREMYLSKYTLNHSLIWTRVYSTSSSFFNSSYGKLIYKNNNLFVGWATGVNNNDGFIAKVDTNGNLLTSRKFGSSSTDEMIHGIDVNSNEEIYYAGYESNSEKQIAIGKTNCKLNSVCKLSAVNLTVSNLNLSSTNLSYSSSSNNLSSTNTIQRSLSQPTVQYDCKSIVKPSEPPKCKLSGSFSFSTGCVGDTIEFKANAIDSNGYKIAQYNWEFGDNTLYSGSNEVKKIYRNQGNYTVQLVILSSMNGFNCADTIVKRLRITDSMKVILSNFDSTICYGDSIQINTPSTLCEALPVQYKWIPNINITNNKIPNPFISPKKNTTYILEITDKSGKIAKDSFHVRVITSCCRSYARISMEKESYCLGDSIQFNNNSSFDMASSSFKWKFTNANISEFIGKNPPKVLFLGNQVEVKLELSDLCSNDTAVLKFSLLPKPQLFMARSKSACEGDTIEIGEDQLGRRSYEWQPNININNNKKSNPLVKIANDITYKVRMIDDYGCVLNDSVVINIIRKNLFLNDTSFCKQGSVNLMAPVASKYLWNTGDTNRSIVVSKPGVYWIELRNPNCLIRDSIFITENPLPDFKLLGNQVICKNPILLKPDRILNNVEYFWSDNHSQSERIVNSAGKFVLISRDKTTGCYFKDSVVIRQGIFPSIVAPRDTLVCHNIIVNYLLPNNPNFKYSWHNASSDYKIRIADSGRYFVRVSSECGDSTYYFKVKHSSCDCPFYIPSVFTPNGDGLNDNFKIEFGCPISNFDLKIYNRWGGRIYQTKEPHFIWNGKYMNKYVQEGTYILVLEFRKNVANMSILERASMTLNIVR